MITSSPAHAFVFKRTSQDRFNRNEIWLFFTTQPKPGIYEVNLSIQSEYRKIRTRNNSVYGHFSPSVHCWNSGQLYSLNGSSCTIVFRPTWCLIAGCQHISCVIRWQYKALIIKVHFFYFWKIHKKRFLLCVGFSKNGCPISSKYLVPVIRQVLKM